MLHISGRLLCHDHRSSQCLVVLTLICCGYGLTTGTPNDQLVYWTAVSHHAKPILSHSSPRNTCQFERQNVSHELKGQIVVLIESPKFCETGSVSSLAWCLDVNYHQKLVSTKNRIHQQGQNMTTNVSMFHIGEPVVPQIEMVTHTTLRKNEGLGCQPSKEFLSSILSSSWFQIGLDPKQNVPT